MAEERARWEAGNDSGTYWLKKSGRGYDELRITVGSFHGRTVYKLYYKQSGSHWVVHSNNATLEEAQAAAAKFMMTIY